MRHGRWPQCAVSRACIAKNYASYSVVRRVGGVAASHQQKGLTFCAWPDYAPNSSSRSALMG